MDDYQDTDETRIYLELLKAADMAELEGDFNEFVKAELICADYAYENEDKIFVKGEDNGREEIRI